jgi:hypothetical protein
MMNSAYFCAILTIMNISCVILILIYPIIFYLITGERILHFGIEIPFLDWKNSWFAYGFNFGYQCMTLSLFICASIFSMVLVIIFLSNGLAQFDILKMLLDQLNQLAISDRKGENESKILSVIKLITEMHVQLINYLKLFQGTFAGYYLVDLAALVFQKTISIFAIITVRIYFILFNNF